MKSNWTIFWNIKKNRNVFFASVGGLAIVLFFFLFFLTYNESRTGYEFNDPIMNLFSPVDISVITFIITYSLSLTGIIIGVQKPELFLRLLRVYALITILRMLSLFLLPLQPPHDMIPLRDPILKFSFYSGRVNLRDLFFSGHTAIMLVFAFTFPEKKWKIIFIAGALIVGTLVVMQHVHYSIDVIAAPVFVFVAMRIERLLKFA